MPKHFELIHSQGKDYAKLLEDAAKQVASNYDAGLLRGLADVMRELPAEIERQRGYAVHDASLIADLLRLRTEAAVLFDTLADSMLHNDRVDIPEAARACRAMAAKL